MRVTSAFCLSSSARARPGITLASLKVSFDVVDPTEAFLMLPTFRQWIREHPERYVLADSLADIECAKQAGRLAIVVDIESDKCVAAYPGLVEIFL
jgi:membrane dipeptidase